MVTFSQFVGNFCDSKFFIPIIVGYSILSSIIVVTVNIINANMLLKAALFC